MWCCLHFKNTCNHVSRSKELHMRHVIVRKASLPKKIVSWRLPCICHVVVLEDMFFVTL